MSSTIVIILVVIAVLILSLIAFLIIRRQRYVRALRGRGWTFESRPSPVHGSPTVSAGVRT